MAMEICSEEVFFVEEIVGGVHGEGRGDLTNFAGEWRLDLFGNMEFIWG
jgi:hypothetical protein